MEENIRTATLGIAEELRGMNPGEIIYFPIPEYNYNSIRVAPKTTLMRERLDGWKFTVKLDIDNRRVTVTRTE